ncbi:hypothetical protein ACT02A_25890 [Klebsiella quasipneumoniae]|uniref:hypothetical protein n=1 Tax=Klebsiella quasipneumoniae TaxID=1463165 RepID=UPI00402B568B
MNTKKLTIVWLQQTISDIQTRRDNGSISWDDEKEKILQAFEIALAAMSSEPVGEFYEDGPLNWYQISDGDRLPSHRRIPLYRHAQPPVVLPDFDDVLESLDYEVRCNAMESEHVMQACRVTYEACLAAMLDGGKS